MNELEQLIETILRAGSLLSLTLSGRQGGAGDYRKVIVRPIVVRGKHLYQFEYHHPTKVLHRNLSPQETQSQLPPLIVGQFKQAQFATRDADIQVLLNKKREVRIITRLAAKSAAPAEHNREKHYIIRENTPCDFLIRLGVMSETGKVIAAKYAKFKQINRFLEMVADVADHLDRRKPLRVIDFGCGKSYLTFALYHYLRQTKGLDVSIIGLDLKQDVIDGCNRIAQDLNYENLHFQVGDIKSYTGDDAVDMVVTLHACDTATDDALVRAVRWGASVILSVPCCQHELFRKIRSEPMEPMLKHGIIKERLSALVTDSLRAQLLELSGYSVQVMEFIDMEHTPKNILIRGVKRHTPHREKVADQYTQFRDFWQVQPYMERELFPDGLGEAS